MRRLIWFVSVASCLCLYCPAFAQDEEEGEPEASVEAPEGAATEPQDPASEPAAARSGPPQWWLGPYVEGVIIPSFILELFLDAAPTVSNPAFGAAITHRDAEGFSWVLGLGYTGYGFDGPFRIKGDPVLDTEYLNSSLGLLHVRGQLLWSVPISSMFAFEYGVGIELGVLLGEMRRTEAYPAVPSGEFRPCQSPLTPDPNYCEPTSDGSPTNAYNADGAHYNVKEERVPPVAAALMLPALGLRVTPIERLAIKLELSFGLLQFTFGLSAAYALDAA